MSDIKQGCSVRPIYTNGAAAISKGMLLELSAARTVEVPDNAADLPSLIAAEDAAVGELVECYSVYDPGELRVLASAAIAAGAYVEIILTGGSAGKVQTLAAGAAKFQAVEAAAGAGELIKVIRVD